jgi:hypothetical protein
MVRVLLITTLEAKGAEDYLSLARELISKN